MNKTCTKCNILKPLTEFYNAQRAKDGLSWYCKACYKIEYHAYANKPENRERILTNLKQYHSNNRLRARNYKLKKDFGITIDQFDALAVQQNNLCAICNKPQLEHKKYLSVDHCHKTDKIRGLLCEACNLGLGHFKDDIELLLKAVNYLNKAK